MLPEAELQKAIDHDAARRKAEGARPPPSPAPSAPPHDVLIIDSREELRGRLACAALQGFIACAGYNVNLDTIAGKCVHAADAVLRELEKKR